MQMLIDENSICISRQIHATLKTTRTNMLLDYKHNEFEVLKVSIMHANIISVDYT